MTTHSLNELFRQRRIWKGGGVLAEGLEASEKGIATGHAALDDILPCRGWPRGAVMEVTASDWGIGELSLFLPLMARYSRQARYVSWIAPPHTPYAPALVAGNVDLGYCRVLLNPEKDRQILWCAEKLLQRSACGLVLAWPERLSDRAVRRLQLAVEDSDALCILWRKADRVQGWDGSPAAMRLRLSRSPEGLHVEIIKARGACRRTGIVLNP